MHCYALPYAIMYYNTLHAALPDLHIYIYIYIYIYIHVKICLLYSWCMHEIVMVIDIVSLLEPELDQYSMIRKSVVMATKTDALISGPQSPDDSGIAMCGKVWFLKVCLLF